MTATGYIILAYCIVFTGLGGYLAWLFVNRSRLVRRAKQRELLKHD